MNECNSIEATHTNLNLNDQIKLTLNEINEIKDYFSSEIKERKIIKLSKYIAPFDYFNKALIILTATSEVISMISFTSIFRIPAGIVSTSFSLVFSLATGITKKVLNITRNKNKKIIRLLCWQIK